MIDSYVDDKDNRLEEKYKELEDARSRQDANPYYRLCLELNVPESDRDQFLYERGEANIEYGKIRKVESRKKRDLALITAVEGSQVDFSNPESDLDYKIDVHKRILGNYRLRISEGGYLETELCKSGRINSALRDAYNAAKKRQSPKKEKPSKKKRPPKKKQR